MVQGRFALEPLSHDNLEVAFAWLRGLKLNYYMKILMEWSL